MAGPKCGWQIAAAMIVAACFAATTMRASAQAVESSDVSTRAVLSLATRAPDDFLQAWSRRRDASLAAAPDAASRAQVDDAWSAGLIEYAYFHWRETGEKLTAAWKPREDAIARLSFDANDSDGRQRWISAWLHDAAWRAEASDPRYRDGDNRVLRARIDAILARGMPESRARALVGKQIAAHIDDNGARGLDAQVDVFARLGGDAATVEGFRKAVADDAATDAARPAYAYRTVGDVPLYLHASHAPDGVARPVLLWFHGGSGDSGHWSYCPILCRHAESLGMLVVQVEYRTAQRFFARPDDVRQDAERALAWVIAHARAIGADPHRVVTAGFSTGASMASQLALSAPGKVRAAVVMSDCVRPGEDAWYRRAYAEAGLREPPAQIALLRRHSPPILLFHAHDDDECPYPDVVAFRDRARALGQGSRLVDFESGGHFFVFSQPAARDRIKRETAQTLADLHIVPQSAAPTR